MPVTLEAIMTVQVNFFSSENKTFFHPSMSHVWCSLANSKWACLWLWEETWPLKTFSVLEALVSQMPSYDYWAAVSISKGLNLGRGSACVFTDSPSDPPAQSRENIFWVYHLNFLSHNSQDLLRNLLHPTSAEMARCAHPCLCISTILPCPRQKDFLPFPSGGHESVTCLKDNEMKAIFLDRFELFKTMVLNF